MRAFSEAIAEVGLKDHFRGDFKIGTAIGTHLIQDMPPRYEALLRREFNSVTMENAMKWEEIRPRSRKWQWDAPDKFVNFAGDAGMYVVGHVLVWHSQVPDWVFKNVFGRPASRKALLNDMNNHIEQLVGRYKGRVHAWDVVNEAVDDGDWRKSQWYNIIGPDFMEHAFHFAHDVDPKAHLLYNDYSMSDPKKRAFVVDFLRRYKKQGVPIHGVGMQGHIGLDYPDLEEFEKSIIAYAAEGMRVHITELDIDVLPAAGEHMGAEISTEFKYSDELNPYADGLPKNVERQLADRYAELFKMLIKHKDKIERVTFWGTGDGESWKNDWPVKGRTNYPLLFDRQYDKKLAYHRIVSLTQ